MLFSGKIKTLQRMDNLRRSDHHDGAGGGDRDAESYLKRIKAEIRKVCAN